MILFMGVAGSGKSIQSQLLSEKNQIPRISIGEILRLNLSQSRQKELLSGQLIKDEEIINIVKEPIEKYALNQEVILDGFPRTIVQAKWLIEQQNNHKINISNVFHLILSKEAAKQRLINRGRPDDHNSAINQRFSEYDQQILPILDLLREGEIKVHDIEADGSVENINRTINKILNK